MIQLDKSQRAFIEAPSDQNIRLLAPAGCGKTLCLLHRCKFLAENSSNKQRFLIVTFTTAARDELRARINESSEFASIRDRNVTQINTLNAWGLRRIKEEKIAAKTIERKKHHSIMVNDLQRVWKQYESIENAIRNKRNRAPKILMKMIDTYKSLCFDHLRMKSFDEFLIHWKVLIDQGFRRYLDEQIRELIYLEILRENVAGMNNGLQLTEVFNAWYEFWCEATENLFDISKFTFEGQKYFAYQDTLKKIEQGSFLSGAASCDHAFVDEFQDINPLDLALVRAIVKRNRAKLTIAGDDDQAIFEWRGATPEYILEPEKYMESEFKSISLQVNYRSPKNIVEHSQMLIQENERREPKKTSAYSSRQAKIEIRKTENLSEEMAYVYELVKLAVARGERPSQLALVSRLQSQIIPYQIYFASKSIPFCAAEDLQIFLSKTFKDLLLLLEKKANARSPQKTTDVAKDILAMCNYVKWVPLSRKDSDALRKWLWESDPKSTPEGVSRLADFRGELKRKQNSDGKISLEMADSISRFLDSTTVSDAILSLSQNFEGLRKDFVKAEDDFFFKDPPFLHLADYAKRYGSNYDDFINDIEFAEMTLARTPPADEEYGGDLSKYPIHLMTALRAKGKEFDKVVLLDVEDGIWPHKNAETIEQLESERRVMYVAFTRAREQVTLLIRNGKAPSPYIQELGLAN